MLHNPRPTNLLRMYAATGRLHQTQQLKFLMWIPAFNVLRKMINSTLMASSRWSWTLQSIFNQESLPIIRNFRNITSASLMTKWEDQSPLVLNHPQRLHVLSNGKVKVTRRRSKSCRPNSKLEEDFRVHRY